MRNCKSGEPVGRVVGLWRYPVKSMAGEPLTEIEMSWHGFAGDRRWAFIRDDVTRSGFPWLTLRANVSGNVMISTPPCASSSVKTAMRSPLRVFRPQFLLLPL